MRSEQAQHIAPETAIGRRVGEVRRRLAQAFPPFVLLSALIAAWELIVWQLAPGGVNPQPAVLHR